MSIESIDDNIPAENRGFPSQMRCFRVDITASATLKTIVLPYNIKICSIKSPVDAEYSLAKQAADGESPVPADATSTLLTTKLPLEAGEAMPVGQEEEFNVIYILPSALNIKSILIWIGSGLRNNLTGSGYIGS